MTKHTSKETARIQEEWTLGSYPTLARVFLPLAAELVDAAGVGPGDRVLDVACGTGNVALTAHRRGADVTGVDITPAMIEAARGRAAVIDADVDWREGDGGDLPIANDAFDVTLSCLGHMFVDDPDAAADELVRATRSGGRIAYAAWTPESGIAAMMGVLSEYLPADPKSPPPPVLWGDEGAVRDRFGDRVEDLRFETGTVRYPALSPAHFWESMTADSGAVMLAVDAVEAPQSNSGRRRSRRWRNTSRTRTTRSNWSTDSSRRPRGSGRSLLAKQPDSRSAGRTRRISPGPTRLLQSTRMRRSGDGAYRAGKATAIRP